MLPKAHHPPAAGDELLGHEIVASLISLKLVAPEAGIGSRGVAMKRTGMPEAAIDEHCQAEAGEGYVGTGRSYVRKGNCDVFPEAKALSMQAGSHL